MQPDGNNSEQPERPLPPPLTITPQPRLTIQPLSSEDSIREAAQDVHSDSVLHERSSSGANDALGVAYEPGSLITEPTRRPQSIIAPISPPPTAQYLPIEKKRSKKVPLAIVSAFFIVVAVAGIFFLLSGKVSRSDLVREANGKTSFLRPKQWRPLPDTIAQGMSGYGDLGGDSKKPKLAAAVLLKEAPPIPGLSDASDEMIEQLRQQLLSTASARQPISTSATSSVFCSPTADSKSEADTKKTGTITGLILSSATCEHEGRKVTTKMRTAVGKDGIARIIVIVARDDNWTKNQAVFQEILDSIAQSI